MGVECGGGCRGCFGGGGPADAKRGPCARRRKSEAEVVWGRATGGEEPFFTSQHPTPDADNNNDDEDSDDDDDNNNKTNLDGNTHPQWTTPDASAGGARDDSGRGGSAKRAAPASSGRLRGQTISDGCASLA